MEFKTLKSLLDDKYSNYKCKDETRKTSYMDSSTYISLIVSDVEGYCVGLCYLDRDLNTKRSKSVTDEL